MRSILLVGLGVALATYCLADELKSGPQVGDSVGPYDSKKCNAVADGVAQGAVICYT